MAKVLPTGAWLNAGRKGKMAEPLLTKKIVKKRVKKFKRPQSDHKISVKYGELAIDYPDGSCSLFLLSLGFEGYDEAFLTPSLNPNGSG
ncbi:hypothetical protein NC651_026781 [Populus alba x Populus x berolinensis]|nr:hypothetical protein NC651_026781 [Populus alba x Populus x berolinensis]